MLIGRFLEGASISQLGDGPIKSALKEIGAKWGHEADAIFILRRSNALSHATGFQRAAIRAREQR